MCYLIYNRMMFLEIISYSLLCETAEDYSCILPKDGLNMWAELFPAVQFDCQPPLNLSSNPDATLFLNSPIPHLYNLVHGAGPVGLASLADVSLATPHGLLFDGKNRLISESYHNREMVQIPLREVQTILSAGLLENGSTGIIERPAILMIGPWSWVYHHWLIENLSRLWILDYFPELKNYLIVVPGDLSNFQLDSLDALGVSKNRLLLYDGSNWLFERLLVPTFLAPGGHSQRQLNWLREKLFTAYGIKKNPSGERRFYISRNDAGTRNISNEGEVLDLLESYNFEVITPGKLSLREQIRLFNEAGIICGTGGSGMTNHIFAPICATLIEIQPDSYINRAHWFSSNLLGQNYVFVIGRSETERHDYFVSLPKLKLAIEMAITNLSFR
jgi:capsular polysaccharide biosynthesis protein